MKYMLILGIGDWFNNMIHKFLLWLDQSVYWLASQGYQLFIELASARIFEDEFFSDFASRIYTVIGVFMLFYLAYALLTVLIDPERIKGDKGVGKIAQNLIISLVLLGFLPSIFDYAYKLQNFILSEDLIGAIIFGSSNDTSSLSSFGDSMSLTVLNVFLNPEDYNFTLDNGYTWYGLKAEILSGTWNNLTLMDEAVSTGAPVDGVDIICTYRILISTAAGIFLGYILLSFALDLGVRVVKLAFYQLIAPIPVIMRIIPSQKQVFDKWLKQILSIYFEAFVKVACMYIAVYFINAVTTSNTLIDFWNGGLQGKFALAIIMMGILMFAKQAPKMISDLFGINTGGMKLGIGEKLKAGGFFTAGATLGAGVTGITRNLTNAGQNTLTNFRKGNILGGIASMGKAVPSALAGGVSSAFHTYRPARDAKNVRDVIGAASKGVEISTDNRERRASRYEARRLDIPVVGGVVGNALGTGGDVAGVLAEWSGIDPAASKLNNLQANQKVLQDLNSKRKEAWDAGKAKMLEKASTRKTQNYVTVSSNFTDLNGATYDNLSVLDNLIEAVDKQGKSRTGRILTPEQVAQYKSDLQSVRSELEDNLTMDYLQGYDEHGQQNVANIDGNVRQKMVAYHTALKNNIGLVKTNLTENDKINLNGQISSIDNILGATSNMDADALINDNRIADLMNNGKKVHGAASTNVGLEINQIVQKEQAKNQNKK